MDLVFAGRFAAGTYAPRRRRRPSRGGSNWAARATTRPRPAAHNPLLRLSAVGDNAAMHAEPIHGRNVLIIAAPTPLCPPDREPEAALIQAFAYWGIPNQGLEYVEI